MSLFPLPKLDVESKPMMKSYRLQQSILTVFLVCMFCVGAAALTNAKGNYEWFPFYSWSMFGLVPQEETTFILLRHTELTDVVSQSTQRSLQEYHLTQKLGRAIESASTEEVQKLRQTIEGNHLSSDVTHYDILRLKADSLTLWQQRDQLAQISTMADAELVATFYVGKFESGGMAP